MKLKIIEKKPSKEDSNLKSKATPLTYRIFLELHYPQLILTRQYFYTGYYSGEFIDGFYFDNGWNPNTNKLTRGSFLTRNFDPEYLKINEKILIEKFYKKLIETEKFLINKLKKETDTIKGDIQYYKEYQKCDIFLKIKRKNKLKEINEKNY